MKQYNLKASGKSFEAIDVPSECYIELDDLLSSKPINNFGGILVVKNVFSNEIIDSLRSQYFSMFEGDYEYDGNEWTHVNNSKLSHGIGLHPANIFVRSESFHNFIESSILKKLAAVLLHSDQSVLSPRVILRSFSHLSSRCTLAHRDMDYFRTSDNSKALTAWIPLGPADSHHGQLVYLKDSHKNISSITKLVKDDRTITSDLKDLADHLETTWYLPKISKGDIVFHCLNVVHASFDTNNMIPRLSCDLRFASSTEYLDPKWSNYWRGDDGL
jgi:ectoine hydroxylase-related dioxygenase (phytanoyl-CoA dioxygenase family)